MQKVEDVIKGMEYLSDADKERILKARGVEIPGVSAKVQHRAEREENRKSEEREYMNNIPLSTNAPLLKTTSMAGMKLHIEICSYGKNGDAFHLEGDVYNQDDLAAIHERFKAHMPRKRLWGLI